MTLSKFISGKKGILIYGVTMAAILFLLKWLEMRLIIIDHAFEIYAVSIAVLFTSLGIWIAIKLARPKIKTIFVERIVPVKNDGPFVLNVEELSRLGISKRELEVLQLMSEGFSNNEIADKLFLSVNTIKTHSSRLFEKLEVSRRTQAIEKARRLLIIP